jgi:hypothetical protein
MLYALLALMAPLWSHTRDRTASQREPTAALFVILSILVADLHRDELHALGLVGGAQQIDAIFMSP